MGFRFNSLFGMAIFGAFGISKSRGLASFAFNFVLQNN